MKISFHEVERWEEEVLNDFKAQHDVVCVEDDLQAGNAGEAADAEILSVFINSDMDADTLAQFDNLKLICSRSNGLNHIDLDKCNEHEIKLANVPDHGDNTVAEHLFALLLANSHNLVPAVHRTCAGDFSPKGLTGSDLCGWTLGVVATAASVSTPHGSRKGSGWK